MGKKTRKNVMLVNGEGVEYTQTNDKTSFKGQVAFDIPTDLSGAWSERRVARAIYEAFGLGASSNV